MDKPYAYQIDTWQEGLLGRAVVRTVDASGCAVEEFFELSDVLLVNVMSLVLAQIEEFEKFTQKGGL